MSTWSVYKWNSSLVQWDADSTIPRPNQDLSEEFRSNQQKLILADGDSSFIVAETKYDLGELTFNWEFADSTLRTKIRDYIKDHEYIKIETHVSGRNYIGRFTSFSDTWLVGIEPDTYNIIATFILMEFVSNT